MTIFIKAKLRKSDDQTNIDKYRVDIIEYHITSKLNFLKITIDDKAIISNKKYVKTSR